MPTIHTSTASTFQCEYCQRFTFKICNKIYTKIRILLISKFFDIDFTKKLYFDKL